MRPLIVNAGEYERSTSRSPRSATTGDSSRRRGSRRVSPAGVAAAAGLLLLAAPPSHALDPQRALSQMMVDSWSLRDGAPSGTIRAIAQTPDGYLWLGTEAEGLFRFDGVRFERIDDVDQAVSTSQPGSSVPLRVNGMKCTSDGTLWVATPIGVWRRQNGRFFAFKTPAGSPVYADQVHETGDGTLLFSQRTIGLQRLSGSRLQTRRLTGDCEHVALEKDGTTWVGCDDNLWMLRGERAVRYTARDGLGSSFVTSVLVGRSGHTWVATRAGLARMQDGRVVERLTTRDGLSSNGVSVLFEDRDENLWIGTSTGGLDRLRHGRIDSLHLDPSRRSGISALFEDREGSLWVGTTHGLSRIRAGALLPVGAPEGMRQTAVLSLAAGRDGALWIATEGGGLYAWKEKRLESWGAERGLLSDFTGGMHVDRDGAIWVGHPGGLSRVKDGSVRRFALGPAYVSSIAEDAQGILVAPKGGGLMRFADGRLTPYRLADGRALTGKVLDFVWMLERTSDGTLWIATASATHRIRNGVLQTLAEVPANARTIHESPDGTVWIGSQTGLVKVAGDRVSVATQRHGLLHNAVLGVAEDRDGHLWLGSPAGIYRLRRAELERALAGGAKASVESFGVADGMRTPDVTGRAQPAICATADGWLWFATAGGAVGVDPRRLPKNPLAPPVAIESAAVDGQPLSTAGMLIVPAGSHRLELHFTAPSLLAPERVRFRHRLDGFDRDWVDAGSRRFAAYTNVPPGDYVFRVKACNDAGVWNEKGAALGLILLPRFYQTRWFAALMAVAVVLVIVAGIRLRLSQVRARFAAVLAERSRLAHDLHDTLGQGLAGIGLQVDAAGASLDRPAVAREFLDGARRMLDYSREETRRTLQELRSEALERADLSTALANLACELGRGAGMSIEVRTRGTRRPLDRATEHHLFRIAQEAITNALKHSGASAVTVTLAFRPREVELCVSDDGKGLCAGTPGPGGFGLRGMRERARKLGAELALGAGARGGLEVLVRCRG